MSEDAYQKRPWVLMSAEAALAHPERIDSLCKEYEIVIVPAEYFQQAVEVLSEQNGQ